MTKASPNQQSLTAKRAEAQRPFHGERILKDEVIETRFRERANKLLTDLASIEKWKVNFNPFIEIGAGSVHRSAALYNYYNVDGVATDISLNSLHDTPYILSLLDYEDEPFLICCDAHHLPFLPNTFNFAFAYQTLHHFKNPIPIVDECHRVLGKGGHFFFNEEPMDSSLRRFLRGNRLLSNPPTKLQRLGYKLRVEKLFWDDGELERSLGMTEARFEMDLWRKAVQPFEIIDIEVNRHLKFNSNLYKPVFSANFSSIIGGNVKGLCQKIDGEEVIYDFRERLMCLDCCSRKISRTDSRNFICESCGRTYPQIDDIIRMFPRELDAELYPE